MEWICNYLLRIICAAILCGLVTGFVGNKGAIGSTVKMLAGIVMVLTMVSPWTTLDFQDTTNYFEGITAEADRILADTKETTNQSLSAIIKNKTEAYILDKADSFGAELTVEVSLDGSDLPVPSSVRICGSLSPYARKRLENVISDEIGIALEDQKWIG